MQTLEIPAVHIRYRLAQPSEYAGYVIGAEDVRECAEQVAVMCRALSQETASCLRWRPLSANALIEQQGRGTYAFTVRRDGELVGVCFARLVMDGAMDAGMFIVPEHRKGFNAVRLAQFVQERMRGLGARWMTWECDEQSGSRHLAEYLNHELISRRYVVKFEGNDE